MVGKKINLAYPDCLGELQRGRYVCGVGVDSFDERQTQKNVGCCVGQETQVVKNQAVVLAGITVVQRRVHVFQVKQEQIGVWQDAMECFSWSMTAGVDANMQAAALACASHWFEYINVSQRFTAGKSHAAAGLLIKNLIGEKFVQCVVGGKSLTGELAGILQANIDAAATGLAMLPISPAIWTDRLMVAVGDATPAV